MLQRPACTGARAWTAWAPTAVCVRQATGVPAASWTWTNARVSRALTGASATTWSTGEQAARCPKALGEAAGGFGVEVEAAGCGS